MSFSRRHFLGLLPAGLAAQPAGPRIDRQTLVKRHNPVLHAIDGRSPLSVGNGEFAFTADVTGLQTFPQLYRDKMPLCTQSQWGWHTTPNPTGQGMADLKLTPFETYGRKVPYPTSSAGQEQLFNWLRENPHRLHLGKIGFVIRDAAEIAGIEQTLDLWTGVLHSEFDWKGRRIVVETACHPSFDMIAVTVRGTLPVSFEFPYGSPAMDAADWTHPARHRSAVTLNRPGRMDIARTLDHDSYFVSVGWSTTASMRREGAHRFVLTPTGGSLDFVCAFHRPGAKPTPVPSARETMAASSDSWRRYWSIGGAIDFSGATDPRAGELERRVVLSQYQTAIQCAGSSPPQETGLTCNSWFGKFHLEMHFWHAAHFAAWGHPELLERSLSWYVAILPSAREKARSQGYAGARWPKMTALDGRDSPSPIGPLLIWQQPHPILLFDLYARVHEGRIPSSYYRIVFETAEFMASFAHFDAARNRYVLGPPVIPAQENHPPRETWNPTFELEYWADALEIAQQWREKLVLDRNPKWEAVRLGLSALPVRDGVYLAHENCPQTFTERNRDHPSMLGALGMLPGTMVDLETMRRTLKKVVAEWKWPDVWGWDFPMAAMTAARLGEGELAMDILMMDTPKNTWLPNGHNWQRGNLPLYLPGNGGLLLAIAHLVESKAFPALWNPRWEKLPTFWV